MTATGRAARGLLGFQASERGETGVEISNGDLNKAPPPRYLTKSNKKTNCAGDTIESGLVLNQGLLTFVFYHERAGGAVTNVTMKTHWRSVQYGYDRVRRNVSTSPEMSFCASTRFGLTCATCCA